MFTIGFMSSELEKILVEKYPTLFKNYRGDPRATCMTWGIETDGDGWFKILDHLFGYLTNLMETELQIPYTPEYRAKHKDSPDYYKTHYSHSILPPKIILDQVKSKYGTLRVYYYTDMDEIPDDVWGKLDLNEYWAKIKRYDDKVDWAISYAEYQSEITCEVTGKDGRLYTSGWYRVLCDEEAIKKGYDLKDACRGVSKTVEY